jgi:hypothetical protein
MNIFFNFRYILTLFITISLFAADGQSAEFYVLLVGDTQDLTLGRSCQSDLVNMKKEVQQIAKNTKLHLNLTILKGANTTSKRVFEVINKWSIHSKDVIFLYFSQHGYRTGSMTTPWPNLFFGPSHDGVNFEYLNQFILNQKPRFLLSVADVCNNVLPEGKAPPVMMMKGKTDIDKKSRKIIADNYKQLFTKTKGSIIISGAIPGTVSYSYNIQGSICTLSLLDSLRESLKLQTGCHWPSILNKMVINIKERSVAAGVDQNPQYIQNN